MLMNYQNIYYNCLQVTQMTIVPPKFQHLSSISFRSVYCVTGCSVTTTAQYPQNFVVVNYHNIAQEHGTLPSLNPCNIIHPRLYISNCQL